MKCSTLRRFAGLTAAVATISACDASPTAPEIQNLIDVALDFCSNEVPVWFAFQNQGESWTSVAPSADGTVRFTATNRVGLAYVRQRGADYDTEITYSSNTELETVSGQSCLEDGGTKTVNGSIAGVSAGQLAQMTMNFSSVYLSGTQTSFSLTNLADRPLDMVASRVNVAGSSQASDRVIIRRNQAFVNNATMPAFDFGGVEAIVPVGFNATVSGVLSGDQAFVTNGFFSQLETSHVLGYRDLTGNGTVSLPAIPSTTLAAGDYHDLFAVAVDANGSVRGVERYFHAPVNQTLGLGPVMSTAVVSTIASSPYVRLRLQVPRQLTYDDALSVQYVQQRQQGSTTRVGVTLSSGFDASGTWSASIPDFSGVSGWQNAWGITAGGGEVSWAVTVLGARPELLFAAKPSDGETVMFAFRSSISSATSRSATRLSARRPRPFARGR